MKPVTPRPISEHEAAVIKQALLRAPFNPALPDAFTAVPNELFEDIEALSVVAECDCGCCSVDFQNAARTEQQVTEAVGLLSGGERVDIIVWANGESISRLEIVGHLGKGELPDPETICSWAEADSRGILEGVARKQEKVPLANRPHTLAKLGVVSLGITALSIGTGFLLLRYNVDVPLLAYIGATAGVIAIVALLNALSSFGRRRR